MSRRFCNLCGLSKDANPKIHLYSVPKDENIRKQWIEAVDRYLPVTAFVCSKHFTRSYIGNLKLLKGAIPTYRQTSPENPMTASPAPVPKPLFSLIKNDHIFVKLPDYWSVHKLEDHIVFSKVALQENQMPYLERSVVLTADTIHAQAKNRSVGVVESIATVENLEDYLRTLNKKEICKGHSNTCKIFISPYANECRACSNFKHKLRVKEKKMKCTKLETVNI